MKNYRIDEQMLGSDATVADANRMVDLLAGEGYDVEYGHGTNQDENYISDRDWVHALATIAQERRDRTVYLPDDVRSAIEYILQKWWETFGNSPTRDTVKAWIEQIKEPAQ